MRFILGFVLGFAAGFGLTAYMATQQHIQHGHITPESVGP